MTQKNKNIESIYPLSHMQQGMLFHTLYAPGSGVYFQQLSCMLSGDLNVLAFERSWQRVVERHPALRTLFMWERCKQPLQVVRRWVNLPWVTHDGQGLSPIERQEQFKAFLQTEQEQGFELDQAPLLRCSLVKIQENAYQFVLSHHHLLIDGWSLSIILKEVFAFYEAFNQGKDLFLDNPRPYRDYIAWLQQQNLFQAEEFWRKVLKGFTVPTPLPVDKFCVNAQPDHKQPCKEQSIQLSKEVTAKLQSLARRHCITLNTIVQGVWALLLSRYSGEEDVVFGVTVSGRPTTLLGVESMVGLFINTLPMRVRVSEDTFLLPWLQQLQTQHVEQEQYSYSPLVEIQTWSEVPGSTPLFESIVVFENYPIDESLQEGNSSLKISDVQTYEQTNYPLTVVAIPDSELYVLMSYEEQRFEASTIIRMLGHFQTLLEGIVANPEQHLSELPLLSKAEQHQMLVEWNNTQVEYPQSQCIHQLFEAQVERTPNAVAVVFEDQHLTYQELNNRANQLAHYLQGLGVEPEVLVGLCVQRSLEMVIGLLGILKAGGAYLPLDPSSPQERLVFMLSDSQAQVLLTTEKLLAAVLPEDWTHDVVCLDTDWKRISEESKENPSSSVAFENLIYTTYTSGSTGKPKGVLTQHQSFVGYIRTAIIDYGFTQSDRVLQFSSISFDVAAEEIFTCLASGGMLVLRTDEMLSSGAAFLQKCRELRLTVLDLPTAFWQQITHELETTNLEIPDSVRIFIIGGEQALPERVKAWKKCVGSHPQLLYVYGSTEATLVSTVYRMTRVAHTDTTLPEVLIGRPISNTQIYILDSYLQPLPIGVGGELYIGGEGLARGYLNRLDLTAERFIPNPFSNQPGARLYKTGDLARYLPDGNIEFLGRLDDQVKIRGFRVEPGEIETMLIQHPQVRESVVTVREDQPGNKSLVAYIVPLQAVPTPSDLRDFLAERLPDYMVPAIFVTLEALPLTPSGKIDKRALPVPDESHRSSQALFVLPRTPTEEVLAAIWGDVLGLKQVGIHNNFFELGGHSLLATQVTSRLRNVFSVEIPIRWLFESPTIAKLSESIEALCREPETKVVPLIQPIERSRNLLMSFAQQRLWFVDQLEEGSVNYNMEAAVSLTGPLHIVALNDAVREIVRRHEALRTVLSSVNGVPVQKIVSPFSMLLPLVDLQLLPEEQQSIEVQRLAIEEALQPFNLSKIPLIRLTLLRLGEESHVLLVTMHHIISDGWSIGIFIHELGILYESFLKGTPSCLPELPIQYADFSYWQHQWLQGEVLETQLAYWKKQLVGIPILKLPIDKPRPANRTLRGKRQYLEVSETLTEQLFALSQHEGATLFMTLIAAFKAMLHHHTEQDDIVIGTDLANRNRSETEGIIGFFVNQVVLRTDLSGDPTFRELLSRCREVALAAYVHQDVPFNKVVAALNPERDLSHTPLFQAKLVLYPETPHLELANLTLKTLEIDNGTAKFDFLLSLWDTQQGLSGSLEYSTDLFNDATIDLMLKSLVKILYVVVAQPDIRLSALSKVIKESQNKQQFVRQKEFQEMRRQKLNAMKLKSTSKK